MSDRDEPEIIAAKQSVATMPDSLRQTLGGSAQGLLMTELQEQVFFRPLELKYGRRDALYSN